MWIICKLHNSRYKLGLFCAVIAYFSLPQVGRNQFVNTQFTKLTTEIADPNHMALKSIGVPDPDPGSKSSSDPAYFGTVLRSVDPLLGSVLRIFRIESGSGSVFGSIHK